MDQTKHLLSIFHRYQLCNLIDKKDFLTIITDI